MIKRIALTLAIVACSFQSHASLIKKTASGICHAPDSPYYEKVSNFVPFNSLKECLKTDNARLPKGYVKTSDFEDQDVRTTSLGKTATVAPPIHTPSKGNTLWPANDTLDDEIIKLDYSGFTVWLNCDKRGSEYFSYPLTKDKGNLERRDDFELDPKVSKRCQQKSADTYKKYGQMWHRGHQAPANNLDDNKKGIYQSNYMTNILPQTGEMNTGAWYQTEYITECYRDISDIYIYGGTIWGTDTTNDYFVKSHGVITPDAFYKIIVRKDTGDTIAWIVPNDHGATKSKLDNYLVSVSDIESIANIEFPVSSSLKNTVLRKSWPIPSGCGRG